MAEKKEEAKKEEGAAEGAAEAKPKGKGKLIIIIAVVVLLLGGGAGAFLMLGGKEEAPADGEHAEGEAHEHERHLEAVELDPVIVNLSETSNFLKVTIMLELDSAILAKAAAAHAGAAGGGGGGHEAPKGAVLPEPLTHRGPIIRDAIIHVLSSKKAAEVLSLEGKEQLKEELVEALNEASGLEEGPVVAVYFNDFIVQ